MARGGGPLEFLRAFRGTPRLEVFGCQKRSKNARFLAPRRGTKTRGFWLPDQNTRFLLRTRKNTTGAEAAHEPARTGASWSWHDQNCKMLPCVFSRGRPSAPYVFLRVDVFEQSASRSCFYEWTRWASAGAGPKIFKKIYNPETRIYD